MLLQAVSYKHVRRSPFDSTAPKAARLLPVRETTKTYVNAASVLRFAAHDGGGEPGDVRLPSDVNAMIIS